VAEDVAVGGKRLPGDAAAKAESADVGR
jgi:hypothetical protein